MRAKHFISRLVAHRGYQRHYPENTLLALQQAVDRGVRQLELDIQLSADQVPMVYHDIELQRISGVNGRIDQLSAAELSRLGAGECARLGSKYAQEPIPTLAAVVAWLSKQPELTLFAEVKEEAVASFGIEQVLAAVLPVLAPVADQCVLISFDSALLANARPRWPRLGLILRRWPPPARQLAQARPDYLIINQQRIPPGLSLNKQPLPVMLYEIRSVREGRKWLARGAALLESFSVGELVTEAKVLDE
ncbi:glycerophosphodiester phosphodiesterase family protein [Marinobacterium arenosum]|uniref:glycerophosphodiester phosphodiesterase family protein n=1 Tax=Marinobacterium arenosum TaxID=2862496 RepID=UPI001C970C82|nr:glycerophosphodiester phosphodiesterase family protein [Marinobacterium arenosum]MBY4677938.1 hypothetical protein [Marinobacterium arenosum]